MEFYSSLGYLVFGSRLRRLSAYFLSEVNKIYSQQGIDFDASWFPVFYLLSRQPDISLVDIASQLQTSHSAVSQLISSLNKKGLIQLTRSAADGRKQLVSLSPAGKTRLEQIQPIWEAIEKSMKALPDEDVRIEPILSSVSAMESAFKKNALSKRVLNHMKP